MSGLHKTLSRQWQRVFGELPPGSTAESLAAGMPALLDRVSHTYEQHDRDLSLLHRSLDISSQELVAANRELRGQLESRDRVLQQLREVAARMLADGGADGGGAPALAEADDLEGLSRLLGQMLASQQAAQAALHASEREYRTVVNTVRDVIFRTDGRGRWSFLNPAWQDLTGHAVDDTLSRRVTDFVHPSEVARIGRAFAALRRGRLREIREQAPFVGKDGRIVWLEAYAVAERGADGRVLQCTGTLNDVTAKREAIHQAVQARIAAEAANRAKSEFLANMSHEIRTPMNGVIGLTDLVLMSELSERQREHLRLVKSSAHALLKVIDEILDFSKMEAGKLHIESVPFDPRRLIHDALQPLALAARQKSLAFDVGIDPSMPARLSGDPVRLRQILTNLVANAIKFTLRGEVSVRLDVAASRGQRIELEISVADTGIGIDAAKQQHVFDAFAQADGSVTRRFGGTGLGLAICRSLAEAMGGDIQLRSTPGAGSVFTVRLPLRRAGVDGREQPAPATAPLTASALRLRVLVADDHEVNRDLVRYLLEDWGHEVVMADNGQEALDLFAERHGEFDLLLMDVMMPGLSGLGATRRIRSSGIPGAESVPIWALTARAMANDRQQCLEAGMNDYITKPLRVDEFRRRIDAHAAGQACNGAAAAPTGADNGDAGSDYRAALARCDQQVLHLIGEHFLGQAPKDLAAAKQAFGKGEFAAVGRIAHALAGLYEGFGAQALVRLARQCLHACESGDTPRVGELLGLIEQEHGGFAPALRDAAARQRAADSRS